MTSLSAFAYGRAATTRSDARFIFDVATISIVRVILRVFSTDLIRPLSSLPLAILPHGVVLGEAKEWISTAEMLAFAAQGDGHLTTSFAVGFSAPTFAIRLYS